ncbi:MAG: hypothetical protein ACQEXJ_17330 [Myxococcota bacterium]
MGDSPISDAGLERVAERVGAAFRLVRRRAPKSVRRRVRRTLEEVYRVVRHGEGERPQRLRLARELDQLDAELRGREAFVPYFYQEGRLALVRAWDPVRIRETIDDRRVREHLERYEARIARAEDRFRWFYRRAGLEVDPAPAPKPWELPYARFEQVKEFLWGRVRRAQHVPPRG